MQRFLVRGTIRSVLAQGLFAPRTVLRAVAQHARTVLAWLVTFNRFATPGKRGSKFKTPINGALSLSLSLQ